ncbi:MAG TPA: hypothetical protein VLW50_09605 [Streptosporangiaceae bacterium]|nr:hypothetical protein [Streptosporangiaceae bacterium]
MLIDCDRCEMRDIACEDCVVGTLLSVEVEIDEPERRALRTLADAGMVPPLRLALPDAHAS